MKNLFLLSVMTCICIVSSGCIMPNPVSIGSNLVGENIYLTFNNSEYNYSLQYPSNWKISNTNTTVELTNSLEAHPAKLLEPLGWGFVQVGAAVIVQSEPIAPNTTLDAYVQSHIPDPNKIYSSGWKAYRLTGPINVVFKELPAKKVTYNWVGLDDGRTIKKEFVYFIQGDSIYTVAYIASSAEFEDVYPAAQKIIDSLTFNS